MTTERCHRIVRAGAAALLLSALLAHAPVARADVDTQSTGDQDDGDASGRSFQEPIVRERHPGGTRPHAFLQYGVAFASEAVAYAGPVCHARGDCILGSGGGLVVPRVGWRADGRWYIGGAYEFSKQDAANLYRLGILQQLRAEGRYYILPSYETQPFLEASAGVAAYGNTWSIDTAGPDIGIGAGVETEISRRSSLGVSVGYHVIDFTRFTDSENTTHAGGLAHFVGANLLLEVRDEI